jgi:predicted phage terminase large subunit-like protein
MREQDRTVELWRCAELAGGADAVLGWVPAIYPQYERPEHLRPVADVLARMPLGGVRAIVSAPPRHGKTSIIMAGGIVRHLVLKPHEWVFLVSHSSEAAEFRGQECRQLAQRAGLVLRRDTQRAGRWQTSQGGGLLSLGLGSGAATGFGCAALYCSDLFPSREAAESEAVRDMTYHQLHGTFLSRGEPSSSVLLEGARWHRDDVAGRLLEEAPESWEVVSLPAIDEHGAALWPSRWPIELLQERRKTMTEYEFSALWQQRPIPRGKAMLPTPQSYSAAEIADVLQPPPSEWDIERQEFRRPRGPRIILSCDPAVGGKATGDFSVVACLAIRGSGSMTQAWLLDLFRDRCELPRLVEEIRRMRYQWGASLVAAESVGGFGALPQLLRSIDGRMRVLPVFPKGDKEFRSESLGAATSAGRFKIPKQAPWLDCFLDEWGQFPTSRHDDQVDAVVQGFNVFALAQSAAARSSMDEVRRCSPFG